MNRGASRRLYIHVEGSPSLLPSLVKALTESCNILALSPPCTRSIEKARQRSALRSAEMKNCCVLRVPVGFSPEFLLKLPLLIVPLVTAGFSSVVSANCTVELSSEGLGGFDYGVPHS